MEEKIEKESFRRVMRSNGLKLSRFQEGDLGCDICLGWKLALGRRESWGSYWTGLGRRRRRDMGPLGGPPAPPHPELERPGLRSPLPFPPSKGRVTALGLPGVRRGGGPRDGQLTESWGQPSPLLCPWGTE